MKRVGFWLRSVALLIDLLIFLLCAAFGLILLNLSSGAQNIFLPCVWLALSSLEIFLATSLGKLILGLHIARADGTAPDFWTLMLRWSTLQLPVMSQLLFSVTQSNGFYFLTGYSNTFVIIGCLHASNDWKQAWHDEWARTAIFRRVRPAAAAIAAVAARQ